MGLATALHLPPSASPQDVGVVICPPIGHEYVHTFRTFRKLADLLAEAGVPTIRFDYRGTGNSFGGKAECRLANWIADIELQIDSLVSEFELRKVILVGFRLGAQLAASASTGRSNVSWVSWANVARPRSYVRELRALSRLSGYAQLKHDDLECGGFVYSRRLLDEIAAIEDRAANSRAESTMFEINIGDNFFHKDDYESMLLEPHYAQIPEQTIRAIVAKIGSLPDFGNPAQISGNAKSEWRPVFDHSGVREELVGAETQLTAGVRCLAANKHERSTRQIVIFPNAGSVHSMGPNRVYTFLARELARHGIDSFRFDLPNLGESVVMDAEHENEPYLANAPDVVRAVIEQCRRSWGYESVTIAGLCSGSYNGFLAALESSGADVASLILINPLTFHWEPGMPFRLGSSLDGAVYQSNHYARASLSRSSWAKFLTGNVDYRALLWFSLRQSWKTLCEAPKQLLDRLRISRPTQLATQLESIAANNIRLVFVFSSRDPGHRLLREKALSAEVRLQKSGRLEIRTILDADHTFSQSSHRKQLQSEILSIVQLGAKQSVDA